MTGCCSETRGLTPKGKVEYSSAGLVSPFHSADIHFASVSGAALRDFELHPLELEVLGDSVSEKRRQDFTLGRCAAREVLTRAGVTEHTPVLRGEGREPLWPAGLVGSISHGGGFGVAAAALQSVVPALGLDIQAIEDRYSDDLIARFADPDEFDWVRSDSEKRTERAVKLFSAKESVFKALYPLGKVWFAFDVAHLTPGSSEDAFCAHVRLPSLSSEVIQLDIGVRVCNGMVVTGATLSQPLTTTASGR